MTKYKDDYSSYGRSEENNQKDHQPSDLSFSEKSDAEDLWWRCIDGKHRKT
jgi:hypothetical protein